LKPGYSILNLIAIPLTFFLVISFSQDVLASSLPLLENKEYFHVDPLNTPSVSNDMQFYPIPFQMAIVLVSGFIFDIYGRRKTLFVCFVTAGLTAIIMPMTSPSVYPGLVIVRILFSMATMPIQSNPLVNDYVTQESKGQGFSVQYLGNQMGLLLSICVLFKFTKSLDP
jgi:MFS family permease